jgi:hypothetical protein
MTVAMNPVHRPSALLRTTIILALAGQLSSAGTTVWDGGGDGSSWSDPLNWVGDPDPVPSNDYNADFQFDETATATTITRTASAPVDDIRFETAGWTIQGDNVSSGGGIRSLGPGTNTIIEPATGTGVFTDTDPRSDPTFADRAFYQVEERQP